MKKIDGRSKIGSLKEWLYGDKWVLVKSSNVRKIRYDEEERTLWVMFKNHAVYGYKEVPPAVASSMFRTGSMGQFVWRKLRDKYDFIGPL